MRVGSLCSGYGGLDLAVHEVLGGELTWVADNDPGAAAILAHRFPSLPNLGDISAADWSAAEPVDVLTAGFPCQDVSCAGGRAGLREGNRTGVWAHVARAIGELWPSLVVLENVRGLLSAGADSDLELCPWCVGEAGNEHPLRASGAVLGDLADLGFDAEWAVVSAADAGAPHRRERVFIAAWPAADACGGELQRRGIPRILGSAPAGEPGERDQRERAGDPAGRCGSTAAEPAGVRLPLRQPEHLTGGGRAAVAPDGRDTAEHDGITHQGPAIAEDPDSAASGERRQSAPGQAAGGRPRADAGRPGGTPSPADAERGRRAGRPPEPVGGSGERTAAAGGSEGARLRAVAADPDSDGLARSEERHLGQEAGFGAPCGDDPLRRVLDWGNYTPAIHRWEAVLGRPAPRPTEPGRTGERLSPAFVEWMQGLPEGWVTDVPGLSRNAQLKALGNGCVPQQVALALRLLLGRMNQGREAA